MSVETAIAIVQEAFDGYNLTQSLVCILAHFGSLSNH